MKYRILLVTGMLLFFCNCLMAQDVFIVVYKGDVSFGAGRKLDHNFRYALDRGSSTTFQIGATALVFTKDKYFTIEKISIPTTYSYAQVVSTFNTTKSQKNNGFSAYLQKTHLFTNEVKEATKGAVAGGVKGIDNNNGQYVRDKNETIFPQDSVRVLSGTVKLSWETAAKTYGTKLIVVNTASKDTIYNKAASNKGELTMPVEKEGTYSWFLYSKLENKKSIERVIIKPSAAEITRLINGLEDFKKQIAGFDEALRALVLDDYLYQNHIVE